MRQIYKGLTLLLIVLLFVVGIAYGNEYGLGLIPSEVIPKKAQAHFLQNDFPSYFNWEEEGYLSVVKDQENCGSCVAFSVLGAMEANLRITEESPTLDVDLSEQDVVSCGLSGSDYGGCKGNKFDRVCADLKTYGVVDEDCFPYVASEVPCANKCDDYPIVKINHWRTLPYTHQWYVRYEDAFYNISQAKFYIPSVETIKEVVLESPIPVGMAVFESFFSWNDEGVYEPYDFIFEGLHAVLITGWDDFDRSWICRNSWGDRWGDEGNFRIPWVEESFDIRNYDGTSECGYGLCICNATLIGLSAVEVSVSSLTTTTTIPTTTTTSVISTTTTTSVIPTTTTTTIIPELYIKGVVVGKVGGFIQGLPGIKVVLVGEDRNSFYITDGYGEFRFDDLKIQTYIISLDDDRDFDPNHYELNLEESVEGLRFYQQEKECIFIKMFGEESEEVKYLRQFREVLRKTELGRILIEAYYSLNK